MTDAGYIFLGYAVTAVALGGYGLRLVRRERKVRAMFPGEEEPWR